MDLDARKAIAKMREEYHKVRDLQMKEEYNRKKQSSSNLLGK